MNNDFLLISIFVFIFQLISCKVEDDSLSRNKKNQNHSLLGTGDGLDSNKSNYLQDDSKMIEEIKDIYKYSNNYKSNNESERVKKNRKKLFPGITPLND